MVDIPEHLLLRSAEARAKALGISVEQALSEMKGESTPTVVEEEPEVIEVELVTPPEAEVPAPVETPVVEEVKAEAPAPVKVEAPAPTKAAAPAPAKADTPEEVEFAPEVKVTQRLLTVVKAKPIQKAASEPVD